MCAYLAYNPGGTVPLRWFYRLRFHLQFFYSNKNERLIQCFVILPVTSLFSVIFISMLCHSKLIVQLLLTQEEK
jgi:hypothetical protein